MKINVCVKASAIQSHSWKFLTLAEFLCSSLSAAVGIAKFGTAVPHAFICLMD